MDNQKLLKLLSDNGVNQDNLSEFYIYEIDGEFLLNSDGFGICLECLEGSDLSTQWTGYLEGCF